MNHGRSDVVNSPYTRWDGDELHGKHPVVTPVWIRLDAIYVRAPDSASRTIPHGLDMTGEIPGYLYGWWPTVKGNWLGVVNFAIPYADDRSHKLQVTEQLVPDYALRKREERNPM
ncbi:hypothetical protein DMH04_28545 [Kibdelosporangium aridum]|uniref:Uncharacterized protein n=2 Tax=Kibdelosporangium aridum TaxID=2030 RepID=A0A428Z3U2_KIBAR|nr:hypothetical protein DMH04_28545 [Kibdelosporangium aridum]